MTLYPRSLLGRTAITIAVTLLAFMAISMTAAVYFVYNPMAKRHAEDFAAIIVSVAHLLQDLPVEFHAELKDRLLEDHGLIVAEQPFESIETTSNLPFYPFFHAALDEQAGKDLRIVESADSPLIWVDVSAHGKIYRLGFDKERLGINPPVVLILAVGVGAVLTLLASLLEVRRVVQPLNRLSVATKQVARGGNPPHVPEDGPEEIASLARTFNRMSADLQQLSENRTVMISGISHDLRTPLTRLGLAVEMLDEDTNPELIARIRHNLDTMNSLIRQFLQFSRGVEGACPVQLDLWQMIESLAADLKLEGSELRLHRNDPPCVYFADSVALERVLANLLKNAAQHGNGRPIDVDLHCNEDEVAIEIRDRGPGIPADEVEAVFRPFHRLGSARSQSPNGTGLGLAIANQLALKHDWSIQLLPRRGGGTVARLSLPPGHRFGLCGSSVQRRQKTFNVQAGTPVRAAISEPLENEDLQAPVGTEALGKEDTEFLRRVGTDR
jgi:two-component system osmolarity sensor histidine kinase EnvZ